MSWAQTMIYGKEGRMKPIALVVPWYGDDIKGGAEQACNYLAHSLQRAGADVEVLTTCVREASADRGKNTMEAGAHVENGILVRRFPVKAQDLRLYNPANLKLYRGEKVTLCLLYTSPSPRDP